MAAHLGRQLKLDLARPADFSRRALVEARCNALAVGWIDRWPDWPAPALVVHGPPSAGKTHLLSVWAGAAGGEFLEVAALREGSRPRGRRHVAIDDCDGVAGDRTAEEALFHLYNDCMLSGGSLMMTARLPVSRWPIGLPDLASRLRAAPHAPIGAPDDAALIEVLKKHLKDLQLDVPDAVLRYAICHIERSFEAAARFAVFLDRVSLRERKNITLRFVSRVINEFISA